MLQSNHNSIESSTESEVNSDGSLPSYLQVLPELRVVLCTTHGSCYIRTSLSRHLRDKHHIKSQQRQIIESARELACVAQHSTGVIQPQDGIREICGLPTVLGFICHFPNCDIRSTSKDRIRQHYNKDHQWQVAQQGTIPWHEAFMQTLFHQKQSQQYFAVVLADQIPSSNPIYIYHHANAPNNASPASEQSCHSPIAGDAWDQIMRRYQQNLSQPSRNSIAAPHHISEVTPFMKRAGIHIHLEGLEVKDLGPSYRMPRQDQEPLLFAVCESIYRVLEAAMVVLVHDQDMEVRQLSRRNARLLNTFARGETSQDPISDLQNEQSRQRYITTWQQLVCYWERVVEQQQLRDNLFQASNRQLEVWAEVTDIASKVVDLTGSKIDSPYGKDLRTGLDQAVLQFSLAIIQHPVPRRKFDSVLVSYAAVRFWSPIQGSWLAIGNYTSILSQLIYDCQMVILASVLAETAEGKDAEMSTMIIAIRDKWLLNDTDGPLSELLENRLLGFRISQTEVPPAQIRWHADGQTLVWSDVVFHLSDIREIIFQRIAEARRILEVELCLRGRSSPASEFPTIAYDELVDNWDANAPGQSFLTDSRNACHLDPVKDWLITRVGRTPTLFNTFWSQNAEGRWVVSADATQQYENAVQQFLRVIMVPFFLGSGQQGRRTEFIGLRWRNTTLTTRDLFLHDGQMLFILSYYKSRNQTNASRWPVRFLLPEVGQLITQYLAIVNPFREFLQKETGGPKPSDYLWSQGTDPWPADTMTRVIVKAGQLILGKRIHIQAWRQITVGIARRKFAAIDANLLIEEAAGEDGDETDAVQGSMSDALHWQASHTPRTGNRAYGGTVNFRGGLTDAGLQEFRHISQVWHRFVRSPLDFQTASALPPRLQATTTWEWEESEGPQSERRQTSNTPDGGRWTFDSGFTTPSKRPWETDAESPIIQRIVRRKAPTRNRRVWQMDEAQEILRRMYGADAEYRSPKQRQAMEHILSGCGQVLAVLRTSEGKSLLYLLPCQLPAAGTTILILPLVVLKTEIQRRCTEAGIEAHIWGPGSIPGRLHSCPLIVVSVEQAVRPRFREFLHRLHIANELDRVVFDECHMILTAVDYRPAMALLPRIRELACQMVFLTGTMPPSRVQEFEETMLLRGARMIRGRTTRQDIYYQVSLCPANQELVRDFAVPGIEQGVELLGSGERMIIYCCSKDLAEAIAPLIRAPVYHSVSGSTEEKAAVLQRWRDGKPPYIVATSAFGMGIDYPRVRWVIHVGVPWTLIDFTQEVGRAGRDGQGGRSVVLVQPGWKPRKDMRSGLRVEEGYRALDGYISATSCRAYELSQYLDEEGVACKPGAAMCDNCYRAGVQPIAPEIAGREDWGRAEDGLQDLECGRDLLRGQMQQQAWGLADYQKGIEMWRGVCMICYHLPRVASGQEGHARHSMERCGNEARYRYFDSKKQANAHGKGRGGWFRGYSSCFQCFQPQKICDQRWRGGCEFPDLVLPLCWAVFQRGGWAEAFLNGLGGGAVKGDEIEYMLWLGGERWMFGERSSNAIAVVECVLQQMSGGMPG